MTRDTTRVAWPFRLWLGAELFFAVAALLSVGVEPADTENNFAWPIQPVVMAALLGAFYMAVAPMFVLALATRRWEMVRVIVIPAAVFTTAELAATILHWDKFSVGTFPFNLWLASYVLPPPIYVAAYVWHQRHATPPTYDNPLPKRLRLTLAIVGGLLALEAAAAFIYPRYLSDAFPWALTPLTTRVLSGFLVVVGLLILSVARENDRDRVRVVAPTFVLLLPAAAVQMARYRDQVDTGSFRFWTMLVYLVACSSAASTSLGAIGAPRSADRHPSRRRLRRGAARARPDPSRVRRAPYMVVRRPRSGHGRHHPRVVAAGAGDRRRHQRRGPGGARSRLASAEARLGARGDRRAPGRSDTARHRGRMGNCPDQDFYGGGERTRTADFHVANVALFQLSYTPGEEARLVQGGWSGAQVGLDGGLQSRLEDGGGDVAPGAFQHGPEGVDVAAETAGEGVGIVHGDEQPVDVVHDREEVAGLVEPPLAEPVEHVAAQLGAGLGQPAQP